MGVPVVGESAISCQLSVIESGRVQPIVPAKILLAELVIKKIKTNQDLFSIR
jgi:hypothetical protein